ncbi:MAG: AFG1 family ATPase [Proteobacteria bacterium]|nr:AFG1 family ATPase [Pseudomonadota bacterium]
MEIRQAYEDSLSREGHVRDPAQIDVIEKLEDLQRRIDAHRLARRGLLRYLSGRRQPAAAGVKGLYIWGGVGRGKTFLMDLFFDSLNIRKKKRIHFHRMMQSVHARMRTVGNIEDPLDAVAERMASETQVLCFDEFYVSDIGDAMLLGRLLDGLFRRGVTLVATSNLAPDDLYKDGLQRQQFMPAIDRIKRNTDVIHMDGDTDYRLRLLQKAGTYLTPDDERATEKLNFFFDESATSEIRDNHGLDINGRRISARKCAKGIAWFDFAALCDGPRSQADYIEVARWYPTVIISGIPLLDSTCEDQTRRFIALVDEFYDRRVKLIVSASTVAESLYSGNRLTLEFKRTVSRLIEMQSSEYLALPHLA